MGVKSSRLNTSRQGCASRNDCENEIDAAQDVADWSVITTIPLTQWKAGTAEQWGFDLFEEWYCQNLKVHKKPWSCFAVTGKVPNTKGAKDITLCTFPCEVFETGREEKVSWWIKDMTVLAVNSQIMVVQVIIAKYVKILVVNWQLNRLLATYSFAYLDEACIQECFISPDSNILLLRQNFHLRRSIGHICSFDANIRIIQVVDGFCKRLYVIEDSLAFNCFGSGLSLDPRICHGRVAIISSVIQTIADDNSLGISLFDIKKKKILVTARSCTDKIVHHARHSSDGTIIGVLCVNMSMALCSTIFMDCIQILCGDSLHLIHQIATSYCGPCKPLHSQVFPMFSRNSKLLAQISNGNTSMVNVHKLPGGLVDLQHICRASILQHIPKRFVNTLPLPKPLLLYLHFIEDEISLNNDKDTLSDKGIRYDYDEDSCDTDISSD